MKRGIIILILTTILLSSFASADIIFNQQINSVYNLGDSIVVPVTIKTVNDISGTFQMDLICNSTVINFYKNGIKLSSGAKETIDSSLVLIRDIIGDQKGLCKIKATLGNDYALSNEFKISDLLSVSGTLEKTAFNAGETISLTGKVVKETGENSNGFIEVDVLNGDINQNLTQYGTLTDGTFNMNISLPSNQEAGNYTLTINAYEKDNEGMTTNNGTEQYGIYVNQVPTNLELIFENKTIIPGTSLSISAILHDQTGNPISSTVFITLKDSSDKIIDQKEISTDNSSYEYLIKQNEPPSDWTVYAVSNQLTAEDNFTIVPKESIDIQIMNQTVLITNTGNVPYNKTLLVKIGDTPLNLQVDLNVGENKKYVLTAPDGEYNVNIISDEGTGVNKVMSLTGNAIDIKEAGMVSWLTVLWIVIILILVVIVVLFFRKVYKKPFFGRIRHKKEKVQNQKMFSLKPKDNYRVLNQTGNKAELSLSIKGEKQDASVVCIKIKNLREGRHGGSVSESIKKIVDIAEDNKAAVYENQDYLFIIFAPSNTKTFKNERVALNVAEEANVILTEHNKKFNQKVEFGISLNYGTIVAKVESNIFKFMSMGSFMAISKKIASLSKGEILLSSQINDSLRLQQVKTEKEMRDGIPVFIVIGIRKENEEAKKFIERFMKRQDRDNY